MGSVARPNLASLPDNAHSFVNSKNFVSEIISSDYFVRNNINIIMIHDHEVWILFTAGEREARERRPAALQWDTLDKLLAQSTHPVASSLGRCQGSLRFRLVGRWHQGFKCSVWSDFEDFWPFKVFRTVVNQNCDLSLCNPSTVEQVHNTPFNSLDLPVDNWHSWQLAKGEGRQCGWCRWSESVWITSGWNI